MSSLLTVSQLNQYLALKLKDDKKLKGILISGEISNFTNHTKTGHLYFTLKDDTSAIKAVMFASSAAKLQFIPESGMRVIISANVQVYERDGACQLYVYDMQPDGIGALYIAFEQLKEKLSKEGLFNEELKKPRPVYPEKIGIVTSPEAAALQDMLNIISRRYPIVQIVIYPCLVQGTNAPETICSALKRADRGGNDIIIVGRGGGSLEDLMAFNSETVARAIFNCETPVISAVGHETDTTIADYAADLRAPTPSAAAELAVPELSALINILDSSQKVLEKKLVDKINLLRLQLISREKSLYSAEPNNRIGHCKKLLEEREHRLKELLKVQIELKKAALNTKITAIDNLSPIKIMMRGYSLVYKNDKLIHSVSELQTGDNISVKLHDGEVNACVK